MITMVLQQSLIPQIFVTGPSIKFTRRRQKLLKNKKPVIRKKKSCFPHPTKKTIQYNKSTKGATPMTMDNSINSFDELVTMFVLGKSNIA
jgi:hypothetical protein